MTLKAINNIHALQIQAGVLGRKTGHKFEYEIANKVNSLSYPFKCLSLHDIHLFTGCPAEILLSYIGRSKGIEKIISATAISTGALATSEEGKKILMVNGVTLTKCKSDLVVNIRDTNNYLSSYGVSIKQCNNSNPTNAQLYFSTAKGFTALLRKNKIPVSTSAENALKQFCGDEGHQPHESGLTSLVRKTDPRRFFWEEIDKKGRDEWENIFTKKQNEVSRLLLQKAYLDDPFVPEFLLHKTKKANSWRQTEVAIYSIEQLIKLSAKYGSFNVKLYSVKKGSYPDPTGIQHQAPRFGIIQMQRGGQKQHPTQLQFNLEAGYFYKI